MQFFCSDEKKYMSSFKSFILFKKVSFMNLIMTSNKSNSFIYERFPKIRGLSGHGLSEQTHRYLQPRHTLFTAFV